jgi:hypothetical protein
VCSRCKAEKPVGEFKRHKDYKDGIYCWCRPCEREQGKLWGKSRVRDPNIRHKQIIAKAYNVNSEWYEEQAAKGCAICGATKCKSGKKLAVDHDHKTKRIRGLLCANCNNGIGRFKDSIELLKRAIEYLARSEK